MSEHHSRGFYQRLLSIGFILLISGCASGPGGQSSDTREALRSAAEHHIAGEWTLAAEAFERAAEHQAQPGYSKSMLRAADARVSAQQWQLARIATSRVTESVLKQSDLAWLQLIRAELALRRGDLESAELLLLQMARLPGHLFARLKILSERLDSQLRAPESKSLGLFRQTINSVNNSVPAEIATAINLLDRVSNSRLSQRASNEATDQLMAGWLELVMVLRTQLFSREQLAAELTAWKDSNSSHPVTPDFALRIARRYAGTFQPPANIAVFLPVTGRYAPAAAAIRDGIMQSYMDHTLAGQSTLRFYQVDGPEHVARAYIDAREDGVDWIMGPLDKESVQAMLELPGFNIPAMLLNQPTDLSSVDLAQIDQLFSFALLPEDEARQMVELARLQGLTTAAVLAPDTAWGSRIAEVFIEHFAASGGEIVQDSRYTSGETDHSPVLRHMLKIDESEARHKALEAVLRQPLIFEAQRRNDLDVIFLAARPRQGRLIKPQLRFFDAGEIPVYATAQLYSGKPDNRADRDLDNIRLPLSPVQIKRAQEDSAGTDIFEAASRRDGQLDGFFGLGMDAIGLLPYLELLTYSPGLAYPGESGKLKVASQGRIERSLEWARFRSGHPETWNPF